MHTYLITGASSGIGFEFAKQLAKQGNNLVLVARRLEVLEKLKAELENAYNIKITCFCVDLSNREAVLKLCADIKSNKIQIDGIINNAGLSLARTFVNTDYQEQLKFMELCMITPTTLIKEFLPLMIERNYGRVINVSSMVAFSNGAAGHTLYPAAKAYILKMSRSLSAEVEGKNIHISALCPGATKSEFQVNNGMQEKMGKENLLNPMDTDKVVKLALIGNEKGNEVIITGIENKLAVALMKFIPEFILTPIIRNGAKKLLIE